ncbi:MAG: putative hydroxymethylpyrimidine transporter CytX, partial [Treponemataceae bacterium]|nr:putative hydroxymethylpyrimidine transporter CytX [Treponemataceae bacterium]
APMIAVLCADFFVLKSDSSQNLCSVRNAVLWLFGFVLYRISLGWDFFLGNTLPVMAIVFVATVAVGKILRGQK